MRVMYHAPRKMTKALDEAVACGTELCRSLALANEVRGAERVAALNIALANAYTLATIIGSLAYFGAVSKAESRDLRKYTINRTIGRFIDKVNLCLSECENGMTEIRAEYWCQVFNSYFGFLVQGNEYRTRTKIFKMLPHEWYVYFNITNRRKVTIKRKYRYDKCNQEPHLRKAAA